MEKQRTYNQGVLGTRNHSIGLREFLVANTKINPDNFETD